MSRPATGARVPAWDLPTRLFHWTLVLLLATAWASFEFSEALGDERLVYHRWNGLSLLTLIVWRVLWGLVGPGTARFATFVRGPAAALGYGRDVVRGVPRHFVGHNPLGALLIVALLALVGTMGTLGLFTVEENELATGPLYRYAGEAWAKVATSWHRFLFEPVLLALAALHIAANVLYGLVKKEPLIAAMITGDKPAADYEDAAGAAPLARPGRRALVCLGAAVAIVFGTILALGGKLP